LVDGFVVGKEFGLLLLVVFLVLSGFMTATAKCNSSRPIRDGRGELHLAATSYELQRPFQHGHGVPKCVLKVCF
jgi:hypothetical protein